jgi:2-octaprenyl-6-methoxyphenol hydroxylase
LGVDRHTRSYGQQALIANIGTARPHGGVAYERFTDEGPLALLPLVASAQPENRCSLVWTLPPAQAQHLLECPIEEFLARLQRRFGYRLGRLLKAGERASYPLALTQSAEQVRRGIVVVGNAAHALHPVAGQGYNLALRDASRLAHVLLDGIERGEAPGSLATLQRYQALQASDQERTIRFSDQIPGLFMLDNLLLSVGRDLALSGLDIVPGLKKEFVRQAAGIAALGRAGDD